MLRGDQIFHPLGHEFFSVLIFTSRPLLTLARPPAEYSGTSIDVTVHLDGLPGAQDSTLAALVVVDVLLLLLVAVDVSLGLFGLRVVMISHFVLSKLTVHPVLHSTTWQRDPYCTALSTAQSAGVSSSALCGVMAQTTEQHARALNS